MYFVAFKAYEKVHSIAWSVFCLSGFGWKGGDIALEAPNILTRFQSGGAGNYLSQSSEIFGWAGDSSPWE